MGANLKLAHSPVDFCRFAEISRFFFQKSEKQTMSLVRCVHSTHSFDEMRNESGETGSAAVAWSRASGMQHALSSHGWSSHASLPLAPGGAMRLAVFSPLAAADRGEACQAFAATGALLEECLDFGQLDGGYRALHECHYCDGLYHARCSEHRGDYHAGFSPGAAFCLVFLLALLEAKNDKNRAAHDR